MRNEEVMMELILKRAVEDETIRMVEMNGSRINPTTKRESFQDYDIVYYVEDMEPFLKDHSWVDCFGERIILQMPDQMLIPPADKTRNSFSYLMLFTDGNRIDLTLTPAALAEESLKRNEMRKILLDKDSRVQNSSFNLEDPYRIQKPSEKEFWDCSNEFWWVSTYIGKALWREELTLAKFIMEGPVRDMLITLLNWHVGITTDFTVSTGKGGKNIEKYVERELWSKLVLTYPNGSYENMWNSLFDMCSLFEELSCNIAQELNFDLPDYGKKVLPYLRDIKKMPKDSERIYR